jgi:hypothetical protein
MCIHQQALNATQLAFQHEHCATNHTWMTMPPLSNSTSPPDGSISIALLITREVRGAVMPFDK